MKRIIAIFIIVNLLILPVSIDTRNGAMINQTNSDNSSYEENNRIDDDNKRKNGSNNRNDKSNNTRDDSNETNDSNETKDPKMENGEHFRNITFFTNDIHKKTPYVFKNLNPFDNEYTEVAEIYNKPKWDPPSCPKPRWLNAFWFWAVLAIYGLWYCLQMIIYFFFTIVVIVFDIIGFCKNINTLTDAFKYTFIGFNAKFNTDTVTADYSVTLYWNTTREGPDMKITNVDNPNISYYKQLNRSNPIVKLLNNNILPNMDEYRSDYKKWYEEYIKTHDKLPSNSEIDQFYKDWMSQFNHEEVDLNEEEDLNNSSTIVDPHLSIYNTNYTLDINSTKISEEFNKINYLIDSGSGTSYSGLSDEELKAAIKDNEKQQKNFKTGISTGSRIFGVISTIFSTIGMIQKAYTAVSVGIAPATSGSSVATAAAQNIAVETTKTFGEEFIMQIFDKIVVGKFNDAIIKVICESILNPIIDLSNEEDTKDLSENNDTYVNSSFNDTNISNDTKYYKQTEFTKAEESNIRSGVYMGAKLVDTYLTDKALLKMIKEKIQGKAKEVEKPKEEGVYDKFLKVLGFIINVFNVIGFISGACADSKFDNVDIVLKNELEYRQKFNKKVVV